MARQRVCAKRLTFRVALLVTFLAACAGAAEDLERARTMFSEALVLEVAGDWAAALAKFQQVAQTRLTPQVRYHFARCKEHLGRLTEALGDYRVAEIEARAAGLPETGEMERARRDLEGRVPTLIIRQDAAASSTSVELDGVVLGPSVLNQPMVVDPGDHRVVVRSGNAIRSERLISATAGQQAEVDLNQGIGPSQPTGLGRPIRAGAPGKKEPDDTATPAWAYVSAGIGSAAIVGSIVLFVVRSQAIGELNDKCDGEVCHDLSLKRVQERGEFASIAAPIALGLGVTGLGVAAWGFWGRPHRTTRNHAQTNASLVVSSVGPTGWGLRIGTQF